MIQAAAPGVIAAGYTAGFYAGFWRRLGAYIIDLFAVALLSAILSAIFDTFGGAVLGSILGFIGYLGLAYFYHVHMIYKYGATLGKMALDMQVVNLTGKSLSLKQAFLRIAPYIVLNILPFLAIAAMTIGILSSDKESASMVAASIVMLIFTFPFLAWHITSIIVLLCNPYKRTLHDFIARTVVVYNPPQYIPAAQLPPPQ